MSEPTNTPQGEALTLDPDNDPMTKIIRLSAQWIDEMMLEQGHVPDSLLEALDEAQALVAHNEDRLATAYVVIQINNGDDV